VATPPAEPLMAQPADTARVADSAEVRLLGKRAADLFGDSAGVAARADSAGPSWDIDVRSYESTSRVEHYVQYFAGPAKERIQARLERGTRYEPMIRAQMRAGGLPEDMYYLALVESGFDQNAYSRAAAVGMWQFMTSTARDMGLRVDWWVDERRDPVKSTGAAVRFIKGLRDQFGSLYLAAAAYNGGPVRVARGLTRYANALEGTSGDDLFFALAEKDYLRNETREYVPQLIAAALVAKEPARYGMKLDPQPPFVYDSVRVGPSTPLAAIAHAAGTTVPAILELNPQVLRGITPPKDSFIVRLPASAADSFDAAFAGLPKSERLGLRTVTSKKGESIRSIATREGISTHQLSLYNPKIKLLKSGNLAPGQSMLVPTVAVASAAVTVPDPSIERYGSTRGSITHVVKSGETLSGIAKQYHTTSAQLMTANGLRRALIFPGQSLVVGKGRVKAAQAKGQVPKAPKKKVATATRGTAGGR
jgi:membrane-bound lytic murein transglycosylase D